MPNPQWIVLVYQAGDNNLSEEMVYALKEMRRIGTKKEFKKKAQVFALFDPRGIAPLLYNFSTKNDDVADVDGDLMSFVARRFSNLNSDPETLIADLIEYLRGHQTADVYSMLVLSGHGSGALGDFLSGQQTKPGRLPTSISIPMLGKVLRLVKKHRKNNKINILGMDSCLMSTIEVAYEVRDSVEFLVAAEGFGRSIGWPFHRVLEAIRDGSRAELKPAAFANTIVKKYTDYYTDYEVAGVSTDHSATDLRELENPLNDEILTALVKALRKGLNDTKIKDAILLAHWEAQAYKADDYVDLFDFCERLAERCREGKETPSHKDLIAACEQVKEMIGRVVKKSCFSGPVFQHSHGLSVYFPWSAVIDPEDPKKIPADLLAYEGLSFAQATDWHLFLKEYLDGTRRERRNQGNKLDKYRKPLEPERFGSPDESFILIRGGGEAEAKGGGEAEAKTLSRGGTMKNPPDGFYREECT